MADLLDGETAEVKGSAAKPYVLRNVGGVYSCTCPAWRNQSTPIERRTCKHLRAFRGEEAERKRLGSDSPTPAPKTDNRAVDDSQAPGLLLAHAWENDLDLTGWWLSEKLDGVRAYWDGRQFFSRQGNLFHAPDWFTAGLPAERLDGELWLGRKAFQRAVSIVRRQDKSDHWREIRFLAFDMPAVEAPFEERIAQLRDCLASRRPEFAAPHDHQLCRGLAHLREELARVESLGGEGLMLRQPGSRYEAGRSSTLLKVKTFHDAEATVVGHVGGAGRHKGRLGALEAVLPDGTSFSIGTGFSDAERENPPAVGSVVTFRYQELSDRGVPRFPSYVRVLSQPPREHDASAAAPGALKGGKANSPAQNAPSAAPAEKASPAPAAGPARPRYFEFSDGKSNKFWEIALDGNDVIVRFGRIGANGQTQTKTLAAPAAAQKHYDKLIEEKTDKGYAEKG